MYEVFFPSVSPNHHCSGSPARRCRSRPMPHTCAHAWVCRHAQDAYPGMPVRMPGYAGMLKTQACIPRHAQDPGMPVRMPGYTGMLKIHTQACLCACLGMQACLYTQACIPRHAQDACVRMRAHAQDPGMPVRMPGYAVYPGMHTQACSRPRHACAHAWVYRHAQDTYPGMPVRMPGYAGMPVYPGMHTQACSRCLRAHACACLRAHACAMPAPCLLLRRRTTVLPRRGSAKVRTADPVMR